MEILNCTIEKVLVSANFYDAPGIITLKGRGIPETI